MDLNVLEYVQGMQSQSDIPEYKKLSTSIEGHKLPPTPELTPDRLDKLFSKLDFSAMEEWPEDVQQQAVELFKGYHHIFALTDLKLGCTSKIKHEIKLNNEAPFLKIIIIVSLPINSKKFRNIYKICWT